MNKQNRLTYREEMRRIYKTEGLFGFTRGYSAMLLRDAPGFGAYFLLYDLIKRTFGLSHFEHENNSFHWDVMLRKFFAGGISGMLTWFLCYPMDTIKTTMQMHKGENRLKLREVIPDIYRKYGFFTLYRGIHV